MEDVRRQLEVACHELYVLFVGSATATATSKIEIKQMFAPLLVLIPYSSHIPLSSDSRCKLPQTPVQPNTVVPT